MMEAARERLERHGLSTRLIAVTVLTSMTSEDLAEVGVGVSPAEQVERLAIPGARQRDARRGVFGP